MEKSSFVWCRKDKKYQQDRIADTVSVISRKGTDHLYIIDGMMNQVRNKNFFKYIFMHDSALCNKVETSTSLTK